VQLAFMGCKEFSMKHNRLSRALALVAVVGVLSAPATIHAAGSAGESRSFWAVLLEMIGIGPNQNIKSPGSAKKGPPIRPYDDPGSCPSSGVHC
jgi:hypothetical protein